MPGHTYNMCDILTSPIYKTDSYLQHIAGLMIHITISSSANDLIVINADLYMKIKNVQMMCMSGPPSPDAQT